MLENACIHDLLSHSLTGVRSPLIVDLEMADFLSSSTSDRTTWMRHALAGWLLMLLASACGREAPATEAVRLRPVAVTSGDYLDQPTRMAVVGNRLVLLDRSAPMVHVFELPGLRHLGSFGTKGNGPGEFRHPTEVQNDPDNPKAFWIYDSGL
ncbi:MAG TPA: hypothetical protein VFQ39_07750, partial [Longimicrobium sp.]|nr:hypothetical protein [Longimicrobium sp.]